MACVTGAKSVNGKAAGPDAIRCGAVALLWLLAALCPGRGAAAPSAAAVVTSEEAAAPRINGPAVFGVRLHSPFLYTIPATGERSRRFAVDNLPAGLTLDPASGRITGILDAPGEYAVVLRVQNAVGAAERGFRIICGERICLTPPMGWNSWNCWGLAVDQDKILRAAKAMVASGLGDHGWTYISIDGGWQGRRSGSDHAREGNEKFPDLPGLTPAR